MKEQFVTYDIAIKLKEKGFDEVCLAYYYNNPHVTKSDKGLNGIYLFGNGEDFINKKLKCKNFVMEEGFCNDNYIAAPLWQQVLNWLADKYKIEPSTTMGYEDTTINFPGHLWRQFNICILEGGPLQSDVIFLDDEIYYEISREELINNHFIPKALTLI